MVNLQHVAVEQPDGTQGIATVELFKSGSRGVPVATLAGCVIHVSKKDKDHRNILKVEDEESNSQVEYFIFVACFQSCRPKGISESTIEIEVKLHRYRKKGSDKYFDVDESKSRKIFEKYRSDEYMVIPCPDTKTFQKSTFLKEWSSKLLLHNNSSQVSFSTSNPQYPGCYRLSHPVEIKQYHSDQDHVDRDDCYHFHGLKKEGKKFKYHEFHKGLGKLEEQGVLLITTNCNKSECERYVIGCYKKENSSTEKYCFLLQGLDRVNHNQEHPPSQSGSGAADTVNHNQEHPQSEDRLSTASVEEVRDNPPLDQHPSTSTQDSQGNEEFSQECEDGPVSSTSPVVSGWQSSTTGNREEEGHEKLYPPHDQLSEPVSTDGPGGTLPSQQPPVSTDGLGGTLPSQHEPPVCTDGPGNTPPSQQPPVSTDRPGGTLPSQQPPVSIVGLRRTLPSQHELPCGNSDVPPQPPIGQSGPMKHTPEQEGETFTHFLLNIAEEVGVEWKFLGRHLGIPEYTIKAIDDENKTNEEKAFQMFDKWQKKDGKEATPEKLKSVLENKLKNKILAEEVQEWINTVRSAR